MVALRLTIKRGANTNLTARRSADKPAWAALYVVAGVAIEAFAVIRRRWGKSARLISDQRNISRCRGALDGPRPPSTDQAERADSYDDQQ